MDMMRENTVVDKSKKQKRKGKRKESLMEGNQMGRRFEGREKAGEKRGPKGGVHRRRKRNFGVKFTVKGFASKTLSWFLCLCLVITLIPGQAFAETEADRNRQELEALCQEEHGMSLKDLEATKDVLYIRFLVYADSGIKIDEGKMGYITVRDQGQQTGVPAVMRAFAKKGKAGLYADVECTERIPEMAVYLSPKREELYEKRYKESGYEDQGQKLEFSPVIEWQSVDGGTPIANENLLQTVFYDPVSLNVSMSRYEFREYDQKGETIVSRITYNPQGYPLKHENALGGVITFTYDGKGNVKTLTDGEGNDTTFTYTELGSIKTHTTAKGHTTTYEYEEYEDYQWVGHGESAYTEPVQAERVTKIIYPDGGVEEYIYDGTGAWSQLVKHIYVTGVADIYEYEDSVGRLISCKTVDEDNTVLREYHKEYGFRFEKIEGRGSGAKDKNTMVYKFEKHIEGDKVTTTEKGYEATEEEAMNASGSPETVANELKKKRVEIVTVESKGEVLSTIKSWYEGENLMQVEYVEEGLTQYYAYDPFGHVTKEEMYSKKDGVREVLKEQSYTYHDEEKGIIHEMTQKDSRGKVSTYIYDEEGRLAKYIDAINNATTYEYNDLGLPTKVTTALGYETTYEYNQFGRLLKVRSPLGSAVSMTYDADGNMSSQSVTGEGLEKATIYYEYDERGRKSKVKDREGNILASYEYDFAGNLTKEIDALKGEKIYDYDWQGNVLSYKDPEQNQTEFTYHPKGWVESIKDAEENMTEFKYDARGNVIEETDGNQNVKQYSYDSLNRLTSTTVFVEGEPQVTSYTYDKYGNVCEITTPDQKSMQLSYDAEGNLLSVTDAMGYVEERSYDAVGNLLSVTEPNQNVTEYMYDQQNRLIGILDNQGTFTQYAYDALDNVTEEKITADGKNIARRYAYDVVGRLVEEANELATATGDLHKIRYEYDNKGQMVKETYEDGKSYSRYHYDALGRVVTKEYVAGRSDVEEDEYAEEENTYTTTYAYDKNGNLVETFDPLARLKRYTYTKTGLLEKEEYLYGGKVQAAYGYGYDGVGNLAKVVDARGYEETYGYDEKNQLVQKVDANNNITNYSYDMRGNLVGVEYPDGGKETYTYDANNRLCSITDSENNTTEYEYDVNGNQTAVIDAENRRTEYGYDLLGRLTGITDAKQGVSEYEYDALSRLIGYVDADKGRTEYTYDAKGRVTSIKSADEGTVHYSYDVFDRVISTTQPSGAVLSHEYDGLGNVIKTRLEGKAGESVKEETYAYDTGGRCTSYTNTFGGTYEYTYDILDRLVASKDPNGSVISYTYDANGNLKSETDGNGGETTYEYDNKGNLTKKIDALGYVTTIHYDQMDRPETIENQWVDQVHQINKTQKTVYRYDKLGQVVKEISSEHADRADREDVPGISYAYDKVGNLTRKTEEDGSITDYTYDALNLLTKVSYQGGEEVHFTYDKTGALIGMEDATGYTTMAVDTLDRIKSVMDPKGRQVEYGYDQNGNLTGLRYPDATEVIYGYDSMDRLLSVTETNGGQSKTTGYVYEDGRNVTIKTYANGERTEYTYDNMGQLIRTDEYGSDEKIYEKSTYGYDGNGNRTKTVTYGWEQGQSKIKSDETYTYDALNRLVGSTINGQKTTYTYDSLGNLVQEESEDGVTRYSYNARNQLVSKNGKDGDVTYGYDERGNRVKEVSEEGTSTYVYSPTNQLLSGKTASGETSLYRYNGLGMRVESQTTTRQNGSQNREYVIDYTSMENNDLMVYAEGSDAHTKRNVYAQGELVSFTKQTSTRLTGYYVHEDIMGSTGFLRNEEGETVATVEYDPWGRPNAKDQTLDKALDISFTGHTYDSVLELYFAEARFYDPKDKVFTGEDSAKEGKGWYQYCQGNPTTYWDPDGCMSQRMERFFNLCNTWDDAKDEQQMAQHKETWEEVYQENKTYLLATVGIVTSFFVGPVLGIVLSGIIAGGEGGYEYTLQQKKNGDEATVEEILGHGLLAGLEDAVINVAVTAGFGAILSVGAIMMAKAAGKAAGTAGRTVEAVTNQGVRGVEQRTEHLVQEGEWDAIGARSQLQQWDEMLRRGYSPTPSQVRTLEELERQAGPNWFGNIADNVRELELVGDFGERESMSSVGGPRLSEEAENLFGSPEAENLFGRPRLSEEAENFGEQGMDLNLEDLHLPENVQVEQSRGIKRGAPTGEHEGMPPATRPTLSERTEPMNDGGMPPATGQTLSDEDKIINHLRANGSITIEEGKTLLGKDERVVSEKLRNLYNNGDNNINLRQTEERGTRKYVYYLDGHFNPDRMLPNQSMIEEMILNEARRKGHVTTKMVVESCHINRRTALNVLNAMVDANQLRVGPRVTGSSGWFVNAYYPMN